MPFSLCTTHVPELTEKRRKYGSKLKAHKRQNQGNIWGNLVSEEGFEST